MTGGENQENRKNEGNFFGEFFKCGAMMLDFWEKNTLLNNFLDKTPFVREKIPCSATPSALRPRYAPYSALCPLGKCSNILLGAKRETYLIYFQ
jgi:hypothetical protein